MQNLFDNYDRLWIFFIYPQHLIFVQYKSVAQIDFLNRARYEGSTVMKQGFKTDSPKTYFDTSGTIKVYKVLTIFVSKIWKKNIYVKLFRFF